METSELQNCTHETYARDNLLGRHHLNLNYNSVTWILNHIDCFVSQSRGNESVNTVSLNPCAFDGRDDEVWDKVGRAIGNLQSLDEVSIRMSDRDADYDDDEAVPILEWETLARILSHVRQSIKLTVEYWSAWREEDLRSFARAIRGHPTITRFAQAYEDDRDLPYECMDTVYSALATLPALESVRLSTPPEDGITLANPESLTELLRIPSLRSVCFGDFYFTSALCQATANALTEGTAITSIEFNGCSFGAEYCVPILVNGFSRNTSVLSIEVVSKFDEMLKIALAAALPSNTTLQELSFEVLPSYDNPRAVLDWSPIFSALGKNTGLQTLSVDVYNSMDESLCTAIKDGLGTNATLQHLKLKSVRLYDDTAVLWSRAFSFLRTSKALKSLMIDATESFFFTLRSDIACMLKENASLEGLFILGWENANAEDYIALITALQHNRTLKILRFHPCEIRLTEDDDKQMAKLMAALLKKNYALESLPEIDTENRVGDTGAILRLNAAGRRYLIEDGSSVSKGVEVLSAVRSDINCSFLHLLENPRLCDRGAVESASDSPDNGGSTSSANHTRKREHGQALEEGNASRRRLT
jgi:hypothetical protein